MSRQDLIVHAHAFAPLILRDAVFGSRRPLELLLLFLLLRMQRVQRKLHLVRCTLVRMPPLGVGSQRP